MLSYKTTLCYKFKDILTYMGVPDQIALHSVCDPFFERRAGGEGGGRLGRGSDST